MSVVMTIDNVIEQNQFALLSVVLEFFFWCLIFYEPSHDCNFLYHFGEYYICSHIIIYICIQITVPLQKPKQQNWVLYEKGNFYTALHI